MSIEKMPVFSEFPNEDPKLSKLIKWRLSNTRWITSVYFCGRHLSKTWL